MNKIFDCDQRQIEKLRDAKKQMRGVIVFTITKNYLMLLELSVSEYMEFICHKLGICFIDQSEYELIEKLHKLIHEEF